MSECQRRRSKAPEIGLFARASLAPIIDKGDVRVQDFSLLHLNHCDPLSLALFRKYDVAAENLRRSGRRQVAMEAKEPGLQRFPPLPALQQRTLGLVLRREYERHVEV